MDESVKKILMKRRDRMIAIILGAKEDYLDDYVPNQNSEEFRKIVLDQINDYFDLVSDILRSTQPDGLVINESFIEKLDEIYAAVVGE